MGIANKVLKEVTLFQEYASTIQHGDEEAFADCENLRSISLPQGMTSIGKRAFCNCQSIEEIILPSSIMKIDDEAFLNCSKLENINIPTTVEYVGRDILKGSISEKKSI